MTKPQKIEGGKKEREARYPQARCEGCGKFVSYEADSYIPFGCPDPECPEPYDPRYLCSKCSDELYKSYLKDFKEGKRYIGDYGKSIAEMKAAKECSLVYIGSNGVGTLGDKSGNWKDPYQYIDQKEYDRLKALPYWGYCSKCGAERKGGYCSDKNCSLSFNYNPL